ncbi:MAG: hypothetical protein ACJ76X_00680 [Solirubrobacteraceae bacterium]
MVPCFRRVYGAGPLHLVAITAGCVIVGLAVAGWLANRLSVAATILLWFFAAVIGHDLVLLPLYSLLDRLAFRPRERPVDAGRPSVRPYLRVPAMLSGLLFLVFFPEILQLGDATFHAASGLHQDRYLVRFLLVTGAMFALSALAYGISIRRRAAARERTRPSRLRTPPAR